MAALQQLLGTGREALNSHVDYQPLMPSTEQSLFQLAMQADLAVYALSLAYIVVSAGQGREWAAKAIGVYARDDDDISAAGLQGAAAAVAKAPLPGIVKFEFDWEKDEWREAP